MLWRGMWGGQVPCLYRGLRLWLMLKRMHLALKKWREHTETNPRKQIQKQSINNKAVRELQKITFKGRWAFISALEKDPIQATVSQCPYMCNEIVEWLVAFTNKCYLIRVYDLDVTLVFCSFSMNFTCMFKNKSHLLCLYLQWDWKITGRT